MSATRVTPVVLPPPVAPVFNPPLEENQMRSEGT